jgi:hypothetical protein
MEFNKLFSRTLGQFDILTNFPACKRIPRLKKYKSEKAIDLIIFSSEIHRISTRKRDIWIRRHSPEGWVYEFDSSSTCFVSGGSSNYICHSLRPECKELRVPVVNVTLAFYKM